MSSQTRNGASAPSVDVVVPTFDNRAELERCLESIAGQDWRQLTVLVCVDGSTDGTQEFLATATFPFSLRVLEHPDRRNHGRARTRNLGLRDGSGDIVLLLDSDMRLRPDAISAHVRLIEQRDCVSVGDVHYLNARENLWARYLGTRGKNKAAGGSDVRPLDFVTANSALRAHHLRRVGGFDESLSGYGGEDTELGLRLAENGLPFVFNEEAVADTIEPKDMAEGLAELRRYAATNLPIIRRRHPTMPSPFLIDRAESRRPVDRLLRAILNPATDVLVDAALRRLPFPLQRHLINYKVMRSVFTGYRERLR